MTGAHERAFCLYCKRDFSVNADGTLRHHTCDEVVDPFVVDASWRARVITAREDFEVEPVSEDQLAGVAVAYVACRVGKVRV